MLTKHHIQDIYYLPTLETFSNVEKFKGIKGSLFDVHKKIWIKILGIFIHGLFIMSLSQFTHPVLLFMQIELVLSSIQNIFGHNITSTLSSITSTKIKSVIDETVHKITWLRYETLRHYVV